MLEQMGIVSPNQLQTRSIPATLHGRDVVLCAYTGSGKTLAGILPFVQLMLNDGPSTSGRWLDFVDVGENPCSPKMLILTTTRELTLQVWQVLEDLLFESQQFRAISVREYLAYNAKNKVAELYRAALPDIVAC